MKRRAPAPPGRVGDTLRQVVQRIDPDRRLAVYRLWTFWDAEVGDALAARAQPTAFRDGVLSIRVAGAAWMQELQFMKEDLRSRLNHRLGAELIRDLYFVSGTIQRAKAAPPAARPTTPVDPEPIEMPPLRDARLAAVMQRIVRAHQTRGRR